MGVKTELTSNELLLHTDKAISQLTRKDAIEFVQRIVNQLDEHHGDSYGQPHGFEGVVLYFP